MLHFVAGRVVDIKDHDGVVEAMVLRQMAGTRPDRVLTIEHSDGMVDLVPATGPVQLRPDDGVVDRMIGLRGGQQYPEIVSRHVQRLGQVYPTTVAEDSSWVRIEEFRLPPGWEPRQTELLIKIPPNYPLVPPGLSPAHGIFLPYRLRYRGGLVRDFHTHGELPDGSAWFCYLDLKWNHARDDLFTIIERVAFDLSRPTVV